MACSGVRNDDLCEEVKKLSLNSSHSDDRTEPNSSIGIEKNLQKILEIFNKESSKDIKTLDVAKLTGIGRSKKAVNSLLHFLKDKTILTLKTGERGADPRWSRHPSSTYTEKNLQEWAAAIVNKSGPGSEAISAPGQPRNIKAKVLSPKRIEVSWLPPTDSANIRSYNVYFNDSSENQKLQRVMEHPNCYVLLLEDLIPDMIYYIQVSATTNGGEGEKSPVIEVKTSPLVPTIELKGHTFNIDEGKTVAIECNIIYEKKYRLFWEWINEDDEANILTIRENKTDKYFGLENDPPFLRILNSEMSDRGYYRCCIEYSTSNGEETVRSKKAHLIVEKAVKPGDTYIDQQVNIKANNINADTINMGGDETNIIVKKKFSSSSSSENASSSENEMSKNFDEINSVCDHEPGNVDINKEKSKK